MKRIEFVHCALLTGIVLAVAVSACSPQGRVGEAASTGCADSGVVGFTNARDVSADERLAHSVVAIREGGSHCSGALVGRRLVLTAAHCLHHGPTGQVSEPTALSVVFSTSAFDPNPARSRAVSAVRLDPSFSLAADTCFDGDLRSSSLKQCLADAGLTGSPENYERHDFALLTLATNAPADALALPILGSLNLRSCGARLIGLGYGLSSAAWNDRVAGDAGTLRAYEFDPASAPASAIRPYIPGLFLVTPPGRVEGRPGDSGGPLLLKSGGAYGVVGVDRAGVSDPDGAGPILYGDLTSEEGDWVRLLAR